MTTTAAARIQKGTAKANGGTVSILLKNLKFTPLKFCELAGHQQSAHKRPVQQGLHAYG